jgi:hypothetical protein
MESRHFYIDLYCVGAMRNSTTTKKKKKKNNDQKIYQIAFGYFLSVNEYHNDCTRKSLLLKTLKEVTKG